MHANTLHANARYKKMITPIFNACNCWYVNTVGRGSVDNRYILHWYSYQNQKSNNLPATVLSQSKNWGRLLY